MLICVRAVYVGFAEVSVSALVRLSSVSSVVVDCGYEGGFRGHQFLLLHALGCLLCHWW